MSNINNFELTSPLSMIFRKAIKIKAGEVIKQGQWFNIDTNGEAVLSGAAPTAVSYLAFIDSERPDVKGVLPGGGEVSLGGMTGLIGVLDGYVSDVGYDSGATFVKDGPLTVKSGKLTPAVSGDEVFAYTKNVLGADGILHFSGMSGFPISVLA